MSNFRESFMVSAAPKGFELSRIICCVHLSQCRVLVVCASNLINSLLI